MDQANQHVQDPEFLRTYGYYRCFIEGFSKLSTPLTALTKKNTRYVWTDECEKSFQELKKCLTTTPMLALPMGSGNFVVYSNAFKMGIGCVLMRIAMLLPTLHVS